MEDTTKGALVGGGIVAIIGAIVSFITYKEGHANGFEEGLAKGVGLDSDKSKQLNEKIVELQDQIKKLEKLKELCGKDAAITRATYDFLKEKQVISDELYSKIINELGYGKIDDLFSWCDTTINAEQEAINVLNGGMGKGVVTHGRNIEDKNDTGFPYEYLYPNWRIVFSNDVRGVYKYPSFEEAILPSDEILLSSPKLLARVKELISGWNFDFRNAWQSKEEYDNMCICENAFRKLEGQYVPCDKVKFPAMSKDGGIVTPKEDEEGSFLPDYEHGEVSSKWLDDYFQRECHNVRCSIEAFWALLSDADKERISKNKSVLASIKERDPISGIVEFVGDKPCVRFSDDICIGLAIPQKLAIWFEGDDFSVRTNDDLRRKLLELIPGWVDKPISDARIDRTLSSFRNDMNRRSSPLPAVGAVRQLLRFKDAADVLCDKVLHDMIGKQITCQTVDLKRVDGVVSETSLAHCSEVEKMLRDAVASVQEELNVLARSRNAVLYCRGDLFPELKTSRYYKKWWAFEKAANIPQLRVGDVVNGVVRNIKEYGAFIDFSGTSGLLHISEIRNAFVKDINTFLKIGQSVKVKIIDIDAAKGRIKLSMKQLKKS